MAHPINRFYLSIFISYSILSFEQYLRPLGMAMPGPIPIPDPLLTQGSVSPNSLERARYSY
jgi:hypothetical protein